LNALIRQWVAVFVVICFTGGCATQPAAKLQADPGSPDNESRCTPPPDLPRIITTELPPDMGQTPRQKEPPALPGFSPHAVSIAHIIGVEGLLAKLVALEAEQARGRDVHIALLEVRQQLSDRLLLVSLDIASASAEINCRKERTDQLGDRLEQQRDTRVSQLTISAIIGGAIIGIMSGGLAIAGEATAAGAGAISGGVFETILGSMALTYEARHDFSHRRNVLREVWEVPDQSTIFPLSVWRYLNFPTIDPRVHGSMREEIVQQWREAGRLGEPGTETEQKRIALFFGEGGTYSMEELRDRSAMLDLLRSHIDLMTQDLNLLIRELLVSEGARPAP